MALENLCNFWDVFKEEITMERLSAPFRQKEAALPFRKNKNLLQFYVPEAEYLDGSPVQFGQINPKQSFSAFSSQESLSSPSLPTILPVASYQAVPLPFPMAHGTTTLAFMFQGGVLAAADTRSSCSNLVACPASQKILPIHSHLVGTTSGTSADCALWKRILARELRLYQLRHRWRLSTGGAARLLSHMLHPFKGTELCVAATLCGWDARETDDGGHDHEKNTGTMKIQQPDLDVTDASCEKLSLSQNSSFKQQDSSRRERRSSGPGLFYVCSDGTRLQGTLFSVGSGSPYAYSILDQGVHWGLSVEEATSIAREAVFRATHRDAYSGNSVDIYHITSTGWTRRTREDLKEEYYRQKERQREHGVLRVNSKRKQRS